MGAVPLPHLRRGCPGGGRGLSLQAPARRQRSSQGRPSKAALLKSFAAFADRGDSIDRAANPAADIGEIGQDAVQVGPCGGKLGREQLVGELIWLGVTWITRSRVAIGKV